MATHFSFPWFLNLFVSNLRPWIKATREALREVLSGAQRSWYLHLRHPTPAWNMSQARGVIPGKCSCWQERNTTRPPWRKAAYSTGVLLIPDFWHIVEVSNREVSARLDSQASIFPCALKVVKPFIYLDKYKILPFPQKEGEKRIQQIELHCTFF